MMNFNEKQISMIINYNKSLFIEKTINIFRKVYKQNTEKFNDTELKSRISLIIDKAISYGFFQEDHVCVFIGICFEWGDNFITSGNYPWAEKILNWRTSPDKKIQSLINKFNSIVN